MSDSEDWGLDEGPTVSSQATKKAKEDVDAEEGKESDTVKETIPAEGINAHGEWGNHLKNEQLNDAYLEIYNYQTARPLEANLTELIESGNYSSEEHDHPHESNRRFFTPPLQYQRNAYVRDTIAVYAKKMVINKLAVLGCGELSLEQFLMFDFPRLGIERIYSVDYSPVSLQTGLENFRRKLEQNSETMQSIAKFPVAFEAFVGDILTHDARIADADVVVSTEVIEHMPLAQATAYAEHVLLNIRPLLFVLSTPNTEYNTVFNPPAEGQMTVPFRHSDHHFEFTRDEFYNWVYALMKKTNEDYDFEIEYIGEIKNYYHLDGATQFCTFRRVDLELKEPSTIGVEEKNFQLVAKELLPFGLRQLVFGKLTEELIRYLEENDYDKMDAMRDLGIPNWWLISYDVLVKRAALPQFLFDRDLLTRDRIFNILNLGMEQRLKYTMHENDFKLSLSRPTSINFLIDEIKRFQRNHRLG